MPFEIIRNDITKMPVDAIVNAANRSLLGGGGVDGAIHRAAGPQLLEECRTLGGCETGEAKITKGYHLPAKYVIHTVGPIWHGGNRGEKELLSACYRHSLELAVENNCESVAFPMISSGAYGYPKDQAMAVAVDTITRFLMDHEQELMVYLVVFGHDSYLFSRKLFRDVQAYIDDNYADHHIDRRYERSRRRLWLEDEEAAMDLDMEISRNIAQAGSFHAAEKTSPSMQAPVTDTSLPPDWEKILQTDETFSQRLLRLIDERGMTDVECYKRANVDRKLFSKIRNDPDYSPKKPTVFAFAVSLRLTLRETKDLLKRAGYSISHSSKFDMAMEYFIRNRFDNIFQINEILFECDLPTLGSGMN